MVHISGKVIQGDGYGRKLGFPTVNLQVDIKAEELPSSGVYAGFAKLMSNTECLTFRAGIVIGPETNGQKKVEAHLIGYDGDAYGKMVTLEVGKFIREFKKFNTEEELKKQIKDDIEKCL